MVGVCRQFWRKFSHNETKGTSVCFFDLCPKDD